MAFTPKPARGTALLEARTRRRERVAAEQAVMREAKKRDEYRCRVPRCEYAPMKLPIDACHMTHRGSGGNPDGSRTTLPQLISLCRIHHGLYDGCDLRIETLTPEGATGPCAFYLREDGGAWTNLGVERVIGLSVERGVA